MFLWCISGGPIFEADYFTGMLGTDNPIYTYIYIYIHIYNIYIFFKYTPAKMNMSPENKGPFQKDHGLTSNFQPTFFGGYSIPLVLRGK